MSRESIEEIIERAEQRKLRLFCKPNKWGYQLNVNNTVINQFYETYAKLKGIKRPLGDAQRIEWEQELWKYLCKVYRACYKISLPKYSTNLYEDVVGWQLTRIEDIVNCRIVADEAIKQLYGARNIKRLEK